MLTVLRHGQSLWNKQHILTGWKNIDLTKKGIDEAINCGFFFNKNNINFNYIFTSDLNRAYDTAKIINNNLSKKSIIVISSQLKERDYGDLSGVQRDHLKYLYHEDDINYWKRSYYGTPPNGENLNDVKKRFGKYFDKYIYPTIKLNNNVLIVSHSNSLRALFVHLDLKNKDNIEELEINNCSPIQINLEKKTYEYLIE